MYIGCKDTIKISDFFCLLCITIAAAATNCGNVLCCISTTTNVYTAPRYGIRCRLRTHCRLLLIGIHRSLLIRTVRLWLVCICNRGLNERVNKLANNSIVKIIYRIFNLLIQCNICINYLYICIATAIVHLPGSRWLISICSLVSYRYTSLVSARWIATS